MTYEFIRSGALRLVAGERRPPGLPRTCTGAMYTCAIKSTPHSRPAHQSMNFLTIGLPRNSAPCCGAMISMS